MEDWNLPPEEIERLSMSIIDREAPEHNWDSRSWSIIRRMIHTTGDFCWAECVRMHPQALEAGLTALKEGRVIITDTRMAQAGISQRRLDAWGGRVECLISDPETAQRARRLGATRAAAAVDLALHKHQEAIYVIGNAPTALFRLLEHVEAGRARPAMVVGLPVGFVNAAESKQALAQSQCPHITSMGRKGGSAVAASVINALAILGQEG